jgi:signal transduction histidine kinase
VKPERFFSASRIFVVSLTAMLLVAATFVVDTVASHERHLLRATEQLKYSSRMLAMHVARSFDAIEILLDELTPQLAMLDNGRAWSPEEGHDFLGKHMTKVLPQIRFLIVFNADGDQRFTSFSASSLPINVKDRPHFAQMRDGAERARYGPYIGRAVNQAGYAVGRRLESPDKRFEGALVVATEPNYFEEFCWSTRPFDKFESALVNTEGKIIGLCRPAADRTQLRNIGDDYRAVLAGGTFAGKIAAAHTGPAENDEFMLFAEAVPGYTDLLIINSGPKSLLLAQWHGHLQRTLLLGGIALFALGIAAWLIRRQLREISSANAHLREHRDKLEVRVDDTTVELNRRRQDERQSVQAKSRFLSAASHDLRQPMQALRLFVGELQRNPGGEQQAALLQRIEHTTDVMGQQLEAMIILSRLDMADIEAQWENISMSAIFRRLASIYQPIAEANGVRLVFLPRDAIVHSDPILLIDLLGHLIDNAIKFSPRGVVLVCARRGLAGTTRIEIRDNGSGIEEKDQRTIYEEFFQVGNTAREPHAGLGLGLSIANRISLLLKAPIALHSKPGAGSVFSLVLAAASAQTDARTPVNNAMPRLLLIDAEREIARNFATQAVEWGYHIEMIDSPESADALLSKGGCIAVIFSDNNCLICDKLRALLKRYPGIVIHPADCQISGLGPYHLAIPVKPARLRALLRSLH